MPLADSKFPSASSTTAKYLNLLSVRYFFFYLTLIRQIRRENSFKKFCFCDKMMYEEKNKAESEADRGKRAG